MPSGFAVLLAFVAFALPIAAEAQDATKVWRIGFLSAHSADFDRSWRAAFRDGLRELQYVEAKNAVIEQRHADGRLERLPELAAELVRSKIDVFVVHGHPQVVRAAERASTAWPRLTRA